MVLAAQVDGIFSAILCFVTIENNIIYNLTVNQNVIIRYVEVMRTLYLFCTYVIHYTLLQAAPILFSFQLLACNARPIYIYM